LCGATTTFAPQAIKAMKDLTMYPVRKCDEDILFVFGNRGGILESRIEDYFRTVFLWSDWQINKVKYVFDDELFEVLNSKDGLTRMLYLYNGAILYNKVVK